MRNVYLRTDLYQFWKSWRTENVWCVGQIIRSMNRADFLHKDSLVSSSIMNRYWRNKNGSNIWNCALSPKDMPENDQRVDKKISTLCSSHHNRSLHLRLLQNCYQFSGTERNGGLQRLIWTYSDGPPGLLREPKLLIFGDLWSYSLTRSMTTELIKPGWISYGCFLFHNSPLNIRTKVG